jgi:branched-chain amino acid transport system ATP-binding protein
MTRLSISGLHRRFGALHVIRGVSFDVSAGERVAMIGPNGAGKSTLVNLISGALPASEGTVLFEGQPVHSLPLARRARLGLIRTYQISRVFEGLTVAENIRVALLHKDGTASSLFARQRTDHYADVVRDNLEKLRMTHLAERLVVNLSLGERRMVELAIALAMEPKLLLLDEPAAGIPRGEAQLVMDAVNALPSDLAVILIEHDMKIVFGWARRIVVLAGGAVIADGSPDHIAADVGVQRIYFGQEGGEHAH